MDNFETEFDWVDAFSDQEFKGNGCAVVYDNGSWSDERCLAYTRETGLTECTFIAPSAQGDFRVRYFLQSQEIPFAGHPTIASAVSLFDRKLIGENAVFETGAGLIPISISEAGVSMRQNAPEFGAEISAAKIARVYGLEEDDIADTPQLVSTGLPFIITLLSSRDALEKAALNSEAHQAIREENNISDFTEAYLAIIEERGTTARLLMLPPNPAEDPFTGSASGAMAAYLWARGHMACSVFTHYQGHMMGREGQAEIACLHEGETITGVEVTGKGKIVMRGVVLR